MNQDTRTVQDHQNREQLEWNHLFGRFSMPANTATVDQVNLHRSEVLPLIESLHIASRDIRGALQMRSIADSDAAALLSNALALLDHLTGKYFRPSVD